MADSVYIVEEDGGAKFVVVSDSAAKAKNAVRKELTVRRATAIEVAEETSRGAQLLYADKVLKERAERAAAAAAAGLAPAGGDDEDEENKQGSGNESTVAVVQVPVVDLGVATAQSDSAVQNTQLPE